MKIELTKPITSIVLKRKMQSGMPFHDRISNTIKTFTMITRINAGIAALHTSRAYIF